MAYSTSNPPALVYRVTDKQALWMYASADVENTYDDAGYISNAKELGMKTGDIVLVTDTTTPAISVALITVNSTTGVGTLTAPVIIA